jgi:hypothetical protein
MVDGKKILIRKQIFKLTFCNSSIASKVLHLRQKEINCTIRTLLSLSLRII